MGARRQREEHKMKCSRAQAMIVCVVAASTVLFGFIHFKLTAHGIIMYESVNGQWERRPI